MPNSEIPTRLHWLELALVERHGRSMVIASILVLIGSAVFWYANREIQQLSLPPEHYEIATSIKTEGCETLELEQVTEHQSSHWVMFGTYLYQNQSLSHPSAGCYVQSVEMLSNYPLHTRTGKYDEPLIFAAGFAQGKFKYLGKEVHSDLPVEQRPESVFLVGGKNGVELSTENKGDSYQLSAVMEVEEGRWRTAAGRNYRYKLQFSRQWQPQSITFAVPVVPAPKLFFDLAHSAWNVDDVQRRTTRHNIKQYIVPWGDEYTLRRGTKAKRGEITGDGSIGYVGRSSSEESKRETAIIMYSSLLGIGVALLAEAFVIILTILVLEIGQKLGWRDRHDEKA